MNAIFETINSVGVRFVDFAVPMLIQSSVLILILLLADALLRKKIRAVFRYWIWMVVLLKLVLPTSLSSPISLGRWFGDELASVEITQRIAEPEAKVVPPPPAAVPMPSNPIADETAIHSPAVSPRMPDTPAETVVPEVKPASAAPEPMAPPPVPITPLSRQGILFLLWLAVVVAMGLLLLQRAAFVRGLVAQAREADDSMVRMLVHCCKHMRVRKKVGLKVSMNATSPAVCGLFRPVILVPENLTPSLSSNQLHVVLLHELAHIKRGDLWVNLAQTVLQILYFYNPLFWLANAIIRRAREQAVDETVLVAMGENAEQYPQALVDVAKLAFKRPALSLRLIGVVESKGALSGRVKRILTRPIPKTAKLGLVGLASLFMAGAVLLPMAKARSDKLNKIAWYDRKTLIKFESKDKPNGATHTEGDTKVYSKNYNVVFRKGEDLLVFAELYETGKPMRRLGHKIFHGSVKSQRLSASLTEKIGRQVMNKDLQDISYQMQVQLGNEKLQISTDIATPADASGGTWGWFQNDKISSYKINNQIPACRFFTLLRYFRDTKKSDEEFRIWIPCDPLGEVGKHKYVIELRMVPLSQLDYRVDDIAPMVEDQLPDGSILQDNFEEPHKIRNQYLQSVKALTFPLPELTAHKYYKVGDPIQIYAKSGKGSGEWKPTLEEIYHDGDVNPVFFLIDGKEYASRLGFGPFGGGGMTLHLPGELYIDSTDFHLPPGRHTVAYGWKNLDVVNPDEPDRVVHFERLATDAAEFEVVEEVPADYYSEIYEEGWEDILRRSIETPFTDD